MSDQWLSWPIKNQWLYSSKGNMLGWNRINLLYGWNKNENKGKGSRNMETRNGIIVWPIRVQYACLTNDCLDQSMIRNGVVPREIDWAGIKWTFYMAGIKNENNDTGSRIMETGNGIIAWPMRNQ